VLLEVKDHPIIDVALASAVHISCKHKWEIDKKEDSTINRVNFGVMQNLIVFSRVNYKCCYYQVDDYNQ